MTLEGMNAYLRDKGFEVHRERDSKRNLYIFTISKPGYDHLTKEFKYPQTDDWNYKDRQMRDFLDRMVWDFYKGEKPRTYRIENLLFQTRGDVERVLDNLRTAMVIYGEVSLSDIYDIVENDSPSPASRVGWTSIHDIDAAEVIRVRDGYELWMPKSHPLYESDNTDKGEEKMNHITIADHMQRVAFNNMSGRLNVGGASIPVKVTCFTQTPGNLDQVECVIEGYREKDVESTKRNYRSYYDRRDNRGYLPSITNVIFNNPATIVFWSDGSKTVVKCQEGDIYNPEVGLAMAISKKALGNQGNYANVFKKWLPEKEEESIIHTNANPFDENSFAATVQRFKSDLTDAFYDILTNHDHG